METEAKTFLAASEMPSEHDVEKVFSPKNPMTLFDKWLKEAGKTDGIRAANDMAIATADKNGKPSVRYVHLNSYNEEGFIFYSNYKSRKAQDIAENPQVALVFFWEPLSRQIRIEGSIVKMSDKESEKYFRARPKDAQLAVVVSKHGNVIESKEVLVKEREELYRKYESESSAIPKPDHWGGYVVKPDTLEFWCGCNDRLHNRLKFRRPAPNEVPNEKLTHTGEEGWLYEYISP